MGNASSSVTGSKACVPSGLMAERTTLEIHKKDKKIDFIVAKTQTLNEQDEK
jgi:hypothetical protein